jgi:tetratricopeptide (TPR) repeat protein
VRVALPLLAALAAGCATPVVVRSVGGELLVGRYVPPRAYALYAIGADAEARGKLIEALAAYEQAEGEDAESPDIWTRIGALRCRLGDAAEAEDAFERALDLDPEFEPAHRERARCALAAGKLDVALRYAGEAVLLDPDRDEGILLRAEILRRLHRIDDARRELLALTILRPRAVEAWRALYALALEAKDTATAEEAARQVRALAPRHEGALERQLPSLRPLAELDQALVRGDLKAARRLSRDAGLPPAEVAVRAAALGRAKEARAQGELVLGADPTSMSALVAVAVAADLEGDEEALARAWGATPGVQDAAVPPSPLARLLLAELLERRVGPEAALAWLGAAPQPPRNADELTARVARRLRERLRGR